MVTGNEDYRNLAIAVFREAVDNARRYPSGFGYLLSVIDFLLSTPKEVAIIGRDAADIQQLLSEVWRRYLPNKVVAPAFADETAATSLPLLQDRPMLDGRATAYVCEHYTCKQPVTTVQDLRSQLEQP